jgi:hypothetical protein
LNTCRLSLEHRQMLFQACGRSLAERLHCVPRIQNSGNAKTAAQISKQMSQLLQNVSVPVLSAQHWKEVVV